MNELPAGREIVLVCNAGSRAYDAMCMLQSSKKNTVNLQGGIGGLTRAGIIL
ncbi:MAG: rhodanese-like domain-containing protein [Desulfobulbaceae bacterium]|nr:rhodanese-like domain-containing protein [Desulfobulbaceae bacterium]